MVQLRSVLRGLGTYPRYSLMRGIARFAAVRQMVAAARRFVQAKALRHYLSDCDARMENSLFATVNRDAFVDELNEKGVALGLRLPPSVVHEIRAYAMRHPCYADRSPACGFSLDRRAGAENKLGKPVLVAQYFNAAEGCPAIASLMQDPMLLAIAGRYLQSVPTFVGANLWWTFAVDALAEDRDRHAHLFHRDVDDFRFFKFFFYLTDVDCGEGAHVCVLSSHRRSPRSRWGDRWNIRRYSDTEIDLAYSPNQILEICGPAGTGFAENTLCVHKGRTPKAENRLLLQLQFALFDYGVLQDRRDPAMLSLIA